VPASSRSHCGLRSVPFWWCLLCSLHCDAHFFAAPVRLEIAHSPCTSHWIVLLLLPGLSARLQCSAVLCCAVLCCAPLSCSSSSSSSSSSSCLSAPAESYSQLGCRMYPSLADRQMRPKTLFQARPGQSSPIRLLSQTRSIGSQEHRGPALSLRGGVVPARSLSLTLAQRRSSRCLPSLRVPLRARERQVDGSAARFRFPPRIPAPTSNGFQEQVRPALCNSTETSTPIYRHRVSEMIMAAPAPRTLEKFSDSLLLLAALSRIRQ
jgi:hypothetical protein